MAEPQEEGKGATGREEALGGVMVLWSWRSSPPIALRRALPRPPHTAIKLAMLSASPGPPRSSSLSTVSLFQLSKLCAWRQDPPRPKGKSSGWKTSTG